MFADVEHTDATYWPLEHTLQLAPAMTPLRQYLLAEQGVLVEGSGQKFPAGHANCCVDPTSQKLGATHATLDEGVAQ